MSKEKFKNDPLWSRQVAADYLGLSLASVKRMDYDGTLPTIRVRGVVRVRRSAVEAYLASGQQTAGVA